MKTKIFTILMMFFLASCGGGSGGSSEKSSSSFSSKVSSSISSMFSSDSSAASSSSSSGEAINGHVVPPEPDEELNNSTLAGVDSNINGIRDDVEIFVAKDFGGVASDYGLAVDHAKSLQIAVVDGNIESHIDVLRCLDDIEMVRKLKKITIKTLNNEEREGAYAIAFAGAYVEDCQ